MQPFYPHRFATRSFGKHPKSCRSAQAARRHRGHLVRLSTSEFRNAKSEIRNEPRNPTIKD
jgi:hypothetical protein